IAPRSIPAEQPRLFFALYTGARLQFLTKEGGGARTRGRRLFCGRGGVSTPGAITIPPPSWGRGLRRVGEAKRSLTRSWVRGLARKRRFNRKTSSQPVNSHRLFAVDHPRDAELIDQHAEAAGPECLLQRHSDFALLLEGGEHALRLLGILG